ncbi:MAG: SDR family oxidoreductase [Sphingomonadales bacterium]|nr:SDR family oxidoreductase [Sphingomonadales bacterium]
MANHLFCFGLGYTASHLARELLAAGWRVSGTRRAPAADCANGVHLYAFDGSTEIKLSDDVSHVLLSIPPDDAGDPVARIMAEELRRLPHLQWLGYLSTTGVYGDKGGQWVDEETPAAPTTARGVRRVLAERQWLDLYRRHGLPVHVFRLAGIYGPGRNQLESLRRGEARRVIKPGQVFSRIHVDDIIAILMASMEHPNPGRIYNVCDDEAAPPEDVIDYAATLLGLPAPPTISADDPSLSDMAKSFYAENKRVRNDRIKRELGVRLLYPTYREGLKALL